MTQTAFNQHMSTFYPNHSMLRTLQACPNTTSKTVQFSLAPLLGSLLPAAKRFARMASEFLCVIVHQDWSTFSRVVRKLRTCTKYQGGQGGISIKELSKFVLLLLLWCFFAKFQLSNVVSFWGCSIQKLVKNSHMDTTCRRSYAPRPRRPTLQKASASRLSFEVVDVHLGWKHLEGSGRCARFRASNPGLSLSSLDTKKQIKKLQYLQLLGKL